jgi:hypothetical protein
MTLPRSQRLLSFQSGSAAGTSGTFTCPDGHITLIKSGYFHNGTSSAVTVTWLTVTKDGAVGLALVLEDVAAGATLTWSGWIVLNPGDHTFFSLSGGATSGWISGSVLAGPNQFPPA